MICFGGVNMLCVPIAQITDGVMKNKPFLNLSSRISTWYCVKVILHHIILNTTSLITVMIYC